MTTPKTFFFSLLDYAAAVAFLAVIVVTVAMIGFGMWLVIDVATADLGTTTTCTAQENR